MLLELASPPYQVQLLAAPSGMVKRYTGGVVMSAEKTVAVSYRVSARFKALLEAAAAKEHRSQTNMLEALLFQYCSAHGIDIAPTVAQTTSRGKCE